MQLEFVADLMALQPHSGWLEKRGSVRKNWKTRYFYLSSGSLKYFAKGPANGGNHGDGVDVRGEVSMLGADVSLFEGIQIHIALLQGDKKTVFHLRAKSNQEATDWHVALTKEIQLQNIKALRDNSCRIPEVVEWYYQYQSELHRRHSFLTKFVEVYLHYVTNGGQEGVSIFNVNMTDDRSGLVLSILTTGKKFNRVESLNNGRVIAFADIMGAVLPAEGWYLTPENRFKFKLLTKEDEFSMEMDALGVTWLQAVQELSIFMKIPKPSARSTYQTTTYNRAASSTMNSLSLIEFSANSGAIFACASDIPLILEGFSKASNKSAVVLDVANSFNHVLKLIPELKCNKETALNFGERIEEIVRVLGDGELGLLFLARDSDKSLLNFHLSTLHGKLQDIISFLTIQSHAGWLLASVTTNNSFTSNNNENAKIKFDHFDYDLINIMNALIKAMANYNPNLTLFDKKEYVMAVDVRKSIEALGGIEAICNDVAKERALARLIQADGHEVHLELVDCINQTSRSDGAGDRLSRVSFTGFIFRHSTANTNPTNRSSQGGSSSFSSYQTSDDYSAQNKASGGLSRYFCCCCAEKSPDQQKQKKYRIQLEEPLVR